MYVQKQAPDLWDSQFADPALGFPRKQKTDLLCSWIHRFIEGACLDLKGVLLWHLVCGAVSQSWSASLWHQSTETLTQQDKSWVARMLLLKILSLFVKKFLLSFLKNLNLVIVYSCMLKPEILTVLWCMSIANFIVIAVKKKLKIYENEEHVCAPKSV